MPCRELLEVLAPMVNPCKGFSGPCRDHCTWAPERGIILRGIGGATGHAADVQLILVTAEPGDAVDGEKYDEGDRVNWIAKNADIFVEAMSDDSLRRNGRRTPFHRNLRKLLDLCLPGLDLAEQLRRIWFTNTVKCAAQKSGGPVPRVVADACIGTYLTREIEVLPKAAFVIALGGKARRRIERQGVRTDAVASHPSARNHVNAVESWERAAEAFRRAKSLP